MIMRTTEQDRWLILEPSGMYSCKVHVVSWIAAASICELPQRTIQKVFIWPKRSFSLVLFKRRQLCPRIMIFQCCSTFFCWVKCSYPHFILMSVISWVHGLDWFLQCGSPGWVYAGSLRFENGFPWIKYSWGPVEWSDSWALLKGTYGEWVVTVYELLEGWWWNERIDIMGTDHTCEYLHPLHVGNQPRCHTATCVECSVQSCTWTGRHDKMVASRALFLLFVRLLHLTKMRFSYHFHHLWLNVLMKEASGSQTHGMFFHLGQGSGQQDRGKCGMRWSHPIGSCGSTPLWQWHIDLPNLAMAWISITDIMLVDADLIIPTSEYRGLSPSSPLEDLG